VPAIVANPTGTTPGDDVGAASVVVDPDVSGGVAGVVAGVAAAADVTAASDDGADVPGDDGAGADTDSAQAASTSTAALASRPRTTGTVRP
jgi:hypothetical protein